jgi:foldase protein PrsA
VPNDEEKKGRAKADAADDKKPKSEPKPKEAAKADKPAVEEKPKVKKPAESVGGDKPKLSGVSDSAAVDETAALTVGTRRNLRSTVIKVTAAVVALLAIVLVVFGVLIYMYKSESPIVKAVAKAIPYPVQQVNGRFVSYNDYLFEVDANKRAYQNNAKLNNQPAVDFNSADGKKLVTQIKQHSLDKLESDTVMAQLAAQKKVKVTDKEVNDLINQLYQRYGGKDTLLKTLKDIYGWDLGDLKKVIRKQLLAKDVEEKVTSDPAVDAAAKAKAQDVLKKVKDGGDFADLAKKNSQASDAASGGDLGFFTKGQLPDNLQAAAEALQPGQVSDVVKTQYGYEIIKVIEKKDDGSIHAQHILTKTVDFSEFFQGELKKAKVNKYIKV